MRDPHQIALIAAAHRDGIAVHELGDTWGIDAVRYSRAGRTVTVIDGAIHEDLSHQAELVCADKRACKARLEELGIPTPRSLSIDGASDVGERIARFVAGSPVGQRFVCKPVDGTNGEGVAMDLRSADAILAHAWTLSGPVLVEEQIHGDDLRLQAIGGVLVAACIREPAQVVGDGVRTLDALVEERATAVYAANPQNTLVLDAESLALIEEQGLALDSVVPAGTAVRLKRVANVGQGGRPVDVTDSVHPAYADWMERIAAGLGLSIFALDVICADPTAPPDASGARALEVNARPQWLHHTFSEGRRHDIAGAILASLLPA
ncbi:MAG: ATP-grasp domain-containing protein [Alphaproteobacteria bacterium]|nr:ATP-grasp domain-containing protein [Alphaproteobacteria bacterium]